MAGAVCRVTRCGKRARWSVTVSGHPNAAEDVVGVYCTDHAREKAGTLWEGSPVQYRVVVEGPFS